MSLQVHQVTTNDRQATTNEQATTNDQATAKDVVR